MSNILTNGEIDSLLNRKTTIKINGRGMKGGQPETPDVAELMPTPIPVVDASEQVVDSATSEAKPEEVAEMQKMATVPEQVSGKFYHVVLDCDFGDFVDDTKRHDRPAVIFGKIAKKINDRIPVVYDKEDAVRVAAKLINMVVAKGSVGVGANKKYPYLGAVVVGFQFSREHYENVTYEKINVESAEGRNYEHEANQTKDLVYWEVNGVSRGTISKQALVNTKIVDGEYIVRKDINPDNGFALLNLVPALSVDDITTLMCMYRGEGRNCYGHGSAKESEKVNLKIDVERKGEVQLGGKYNDFKSLAIREKAKYLLNKKKGQTGGQPSEDLEGYYKQKYIQKKNEYLRLKAQKGGQPNDDEESWRQKYIQKKNEYLRLKAQKGGQKGGDGEEINHPTDDSDFWRPLYQQKKAEYISLKNKRHSK
jgi:hypothetical protein